MNPYCLKVVEKMADHIKRPRRYQYVFIRVHDHTDAPALWHLDSALNPVAYYENFIFVVGEERTEFIETPMTIRHAQSAKDFHDQAAMLLKLSSRPRALNVVTIPNATIVAYGGSNVHRGPKVTKRRMLIRLSNTDQVHPATWDNPDTRPWWNVYS